MAAAKAAEGTEEDAWGVAVEGERVAVAMAAAAALEAAVDRARMAVMAVVREAVAVVAKVAEDLEVVEEVEADTVVNA